jgi:hypothetical protein
VGTYFDSAGILQSAASGVPRFDFDPVTHAAKGILIEESRTNSIPKSQISGVTNGIIGSGGVLPSGWTSQISTTGSGSLSGQILGSGTSNGLQYIDIRFQGNVTSGTGILAINLGNIATTPGITYTSSMYVSVIGGSTANISSFNFKGKYLNSILSYISESPSGIAYTGPILLRQSQTFTTPANTATIIPCYNIYTGVGAVDITVRYAAPQLEQGAFSTSYIPTTTAAVTRAADIFRIPTGSWYNQSAGSFYNNVKWASISGVTYPLFLQFNDTTVNNRWNAYYKQLTSTVGVDAITTSVTQGSWGTAAGISGTKKIAAAQFLNNTNVAFDGAIQTLDTSWTPPTVTRLVLSGAGSEANIWHKTLKYYPLRVADTQLQLMTQ